MTVTGRRRSWRIVAVLVGCLVGGCGGLVVTTDDGATPVGAGAVADAQAGADSAPELPPPLTPPALPPPLPESQVASDQRTFDKVGQITGGLTPKSVVASSNGLIVAQNMIYTHTVSAFASDGALLATIDDAVVPSDFGYDEWTQKVKGGPVEAAFSPDGRSVWVSNYSMYGPGFSHPGGDSCGPKNGADPSFVYRIDTASLEVADIVKVAAVPKFVAVTPDGRYVLVTTWCGYTLSIIDVEADGGPREVTSLPIGRHPRGIAVSPDSATVYVAVMGGSDIAVVDRDAAVADADQPISWFKGVGASPRHLNLSPDGSALYVTLNGAGKVARVDTATGKVEATVRTGSQPRSAVLSPDGTVLFVVNYDSGTVSRVRTSDMTVLESAKVPHHPIGITYDPTTQRVWVASYGGQLTVFDDKP